MIYNSNRTYLSEGSIEADLAYATPVGALEAAFESAKMEETIFESLIMNDFQEAEAMHASNRDAAMLEFAAIQEASIGSVWRSFIELLKKIGAKIKAIFDRFAALLTALITKDTAVLVKKYEAKVNANDYSKMAVKGYKPLKEIRHPLNWMAFKEIAGHIDSFSRQENVDAMEKAIKSKNDFFGVLLSKSAVRDEEAFRKDLEDKMFGTATDSAGAVKTDMSNIITLLKDNKIVNDVKKEQATIEKELNELRRTAEAKEKEASNRKEGSADYESRNHEMAAASKCITELNNANGAVTNAFNAWSGNIKKAIAQSKKVFVMAATYTPKKAAYEAAILFEAEGNVIEESVLDWFEEY